MTGGETAPGGRRCVEARSDVWSSSAGVVREGDGLDTDKRPSSSERSLIRILPVVDGGERGELGRSLGFLSLLLHQRESPVPLLKLLLHRKE